MESTTANVDVKEYIKIFGRLGEKMIFGDASAGLCCHSACDDCEWRYTFDVMQSARPKWIPTYRENRFEDGREHITKWSAIFEDGDAPVGKEEFTERLAAIKFEMPLGPSGFLTAKQADLSPEVLDVFWSYIARGKPTLTAKQFSIRLKKMLSSPDGDDGVRCSSVTLRALLACFRNPARTACLLRQPARPALLACWKGLTPASHAGDTDIAGYC